MNKGISIFRNCVSVVTDNKSFGSVLTKINEVRKGLDYMLNIIFAFLYRLL